MGYGPRLKRRWRSRGAVMVEYAFLLVFVAFPTALGLMLGGWHMLNAYQTARQDMLRNVP